MARVLLIEDDPEIAGQLVNGLRGAGYSVQLAVYGAAARQAALAGSYDILLLDLMIPGGDGFELLTELRKTSDVPVVVLTARTSLNDRLQSFSLGADDYLPKPFYFEELLARIQARLERTPPARPAGLLIGDVQLDTDRRQALRDGRDLGLTPHEFAVLSWLVARPGRSITRRQLLDGALPEETRAQERTIDSHIAHIRKKLGPASKQIRTAFRVGYRFEPS